MSFVLVLVSIALAGTPESFSSSYAAEKKGDYTAALSALSAVPAEGDTAYVLALRRGWLGYLQGAHAESVLSYREAGKLRPESVEARLGEALPLMALRRWTEAQAACEAALRLAPGDYTAAGRLAWVLYSQGKYGEALVRYEAVVREYPADLDLRAGYGWTLLKLGRTAEARGVFRWILTVAPDHVGAKAGVEGAG